MVEVICNGNLENMALLRRMGLKIGRDYQSQKGAVAKGRPNSILLTFKNKDHALFFKLRAK